MQSPSYWPGTWTERRWDLAAACSAPTTGRIAAAYNHELDRERTTSPPFVVAAAAVDAVVAVEAGGQLQPRAYPLAVLEPYPTPLANLPPAWMMSIRI